MNRRLAPTLAVCLLLGAASNAEARSFRTAQIPDGGSLCTNCHTSAAGGARNAFGNDILLNYLDGNGTASRADDDVLWGPELAALDSDGDGYTNGEELGDPLGLWAIGDANPSTIPTNPGLASSTLCGDGRINGPEECDNAELDGATCADFAFDGGSLACSRTCEFDTSDCFLDTPDTGGDAGSDGGTDAGSDAGDAGSDAGDAGDADADPDTASDVGADADLDTDLDTDPDSASDAGADSDASDSDANSDAGGNDSGTDAGADDASADADPDTDGGADAGDAADTGATPDVGQDETGIDTADGGASGGCAAAPGGSTPLSLLALALGALIRRRRS